MNARIIEIEREEIAPGLFRRLMWSNVPSDELSFEDTQEFFDRTARMWPLREVISSIWRRRMRQDMENQPDHFFESIYAPPQKEKVPQSTVKKLN